MFTIAVGRKEIVCKKKMGPHHKRSKIFKPIGSKRVPTKGKRIT